MKILCIIHPVSALLSTLLISPPIDKSIWQPKQTARSEVSFLEFILSIYEYDLKLPIRPTEFTCRRLYPLEVDIALVTDPAY